MAAGQAKHGEKVRQNILNMIIKYIEIHGYPPTMREIGKEVGLRSTSSIKSHIDEMLCAGMLETDVTEPGASRALRVPGYKLVKIQEEQKS